MAKRISEIEGIGAKTSAALSAAGVKTVDDLLDDLDDFDIDEPESDSLEQEEPDAALDEFDEIDIDELDLDLDDSAEEQEENDELIDIDDILDLPDDAIDIDSLVDDEK